MVNRLISDIDIALDAKAYIAALALMLILPDICAKVEYGKQKRNKEFYIKWFDENYSQFEEQIFIDEEYPLPYLSGEVVYQLRCMLLHQGTPNIDTTKIKNPSCKIDHFILITESKKESDIYVGCASYQSICGCEPTDRTYELNIQQFWKKLKAIVLAYYKENKAKFESFQYSIIDIDEKLEK